MGNAGYVLCHGSEGEQTDFLAHEFGAGSAVEHVARSVNQKADNEFGYGVGVLSGGVHHHYVVGRGGFEVDIVVTGTGAYHDFQILTGFDNFGVDFVGTDDDGVHVGYGCEEFFLFGVFFKQHYFVAYGLENVLNTLNGHGGKGFFGSNQNFLHCVFGINDRFSSGAKVLGNETTSTLAPT